MNKETTILAVDDQELVRELMQTMLAMEGYRVLVAAGGHAALAMAEGHSGPIDLLVTDVSMPGMDGLELASRLRQLRPEVRVLFVSGERNHSGINQGVEAGTIFFLAKPFRRDELVGKVKEVLRSDRTQSRVSPSLSA